MSFSEMDIINVIQFIIYGIPLILLWCLIVVKLFKAVRKAFKY